MKIKKNWPYLYGFILAFTDLVVFNLAFVLAYYLRFNSFLNLEKYLYLLGVADALFFPLAFFTGVYRSVFQTSLENQKAHLRKFSFYLALVFMSYLFITKGHEYSRGVVLIFLMSQHLLLQLNHTLMHRFNLLLVQRGFGCKRTLLVGTDASARLFYEQLHDVFGDFYDVLGFVSNGRARYTDPLIKPHILGGYQDMKRLVRENGVEQVFVVSDSLNLSKYEPVLSACESVGVPVKMVSPGIRNLMKQIKVKDVTGVPLTSAYDKRFRFNRFRRRSKRLFDLAVATAVSFVALPVGLAIAAIIKLTSPGPVFFKQKRSLYKGGPEFLFYKFRTMYVNADKMKEKLVEKNETNGVLFKIKKDPRVTPIGRFLRKYSLDELPQLINVFKGEMSIVGPRPLPVKDFELLGDQVAIYQWYSKRGATLPGITGLWQISGRSNLSFEEMCMLDLYYIENQNILFDLEILFETIPVMLFGRGAY